MNDKNTIYLVDRLESLSHEYGELYGRVSALMGYIRSKEENQARYYDSLSSTITINVQVDSSAIEQLLGFAPSSAAEHIVKEHNDKISALVEKGEKSNEDNTRI